MSQEDSRASLSYQKEPRRREGRVPERRVLTHIKNPSMWRPDAGQGFSEPYPLTARPKNSCAVERHPGNSFGQCTARVSVGMYERVLGERMASP